MKRLSTRCMQHLSSINNENPEREESNPRQQTMDFLTQFARVYRAEPTLGDELCSFVLN